MSKLYYTPPSDSIFEDMRNVAIIIWRRYNDPRYVTEKLKRIENIKNVGDNFMYIFSMFDQKNQRECAFLLEKDTKEAVYDRMISGGNGIALTESVLGAPETWL